MSKDRWVRFLAVHLILIFIVIFFLVDLEVAEVVGIFVRGNNPQPITEVVLLQVFLGKVLQIPVWRCKNKMDICMTEELYIVSAMFFTNGSSQNNQLYYNS